MSVFSTRTMPALGAALLLAGVITACKSKDEGAAASAVADSAATKNAMASADKAATPVAAPAWSNAATISYAHAANNGEIMLGKLAEKKATSADVKGFAKMMVTDHTAMMNETKALAKKTNTMTDSTIADVADLMKHGHDELTDLTAKAAGADWDKNYMDKAVSDHKDVLDHLQNAAKGTTDADISTALTGAIAKVQAHLTAAQDIRTKLGS
ncbi:MAG: hypothetical protein JWM95_5310 [Gemmatimonadetes bacterium]|nr:hypothetical protein [Gemmatimonadota bacterium]